MEELVSMLLIFLVIVFVLVFRVRWFIPWGWLYTDKEERENPNIINVHQLNVDFQNGHVFTLRKRKWLIWLESIFSPPKYK